MAISGISAELINETMWLVYFALLKKSSNTNGSNFIINGVEITEKYMVNLFSQGGNKLTGLIKNMRISSDFSEMDYEISYLDRALDEKKATIFFIKNEWHDALMSQVKKFSQNQKVSFVKGSGFKIIRQDDFYEKTGIDSFLKKVFKTFTVTSAKSDRWNPADVWFYTPDAIKSIKDYISVCIINNSSNLVGLRKQEQKKLALNDVIGLNKLILKLYEEKKLAPISLKKATGIKGSYTFRLSEVNIPKNEKGRPKDAKILEKPLPIKEFGNSFVAGESGRGANDLKFVIEVDQIVLNTDGTISYERQKDTITYNSKGHTLTSLSKGFEKAAGGSAGMDVVETVVYNALGAREVKKARGNIFKQQLSPNLISSGKMIGKDYDERLGNSLQYVGELAKLLNSGLKNKEVLLATASGAREQRQRDKDVYVGMQNKMEISTAIHKSNKADEIILDLWSAIVGKGITNRKDYEVLIEKIGNVKYKQSQKKGQRRLTQDQADDEALKLIVASKLEGNPLKIPGSFHLKLY
jgi:hypothetical protein